MTADVLQTEEVLTVKSDKGGMVLVATSDLQGREQDPKNRLLGELVAEELAVLHELGEIPFIHGVLLAGWLNVRYLCC